MCEARGYTPTQVGDMTLDQIWFMLCDIKILEAKSKYKRSPTGKAGDTLRTQLVDKDGWVKGRAADGTPIKGRFSGKSVAQMIREKAAAERKEKGH